MKFELNMPLGDGQRAFLDHLNARLRTRMKGYSGESGFLDDGTYHSSVTGQFTVEDNEVPLTWMISKSKDGTLSWIEVSPTDPLKDSNSLESEIRDFVTNVMAAALNDSKEKFFYERLFHYIGPQLDSEYWLPGFRFAPAIPDDTDLVLINAERIVSISFNVSAIDKDTAHAVGLERAKRYSARLSLILDVGLYEPLPEQRWVIMPGDSGSPAESHRYQLGIARPGIHLSSMPKKGEFALLGDSKDR
jgi:hypothetical protein